MVSLELWHNENTNINVRKTNTEKSQFMMIRLNALEYRLEIRDEVMTL